MNKRIQDLTGLSLDEIATEFIRGGSLRTDHVATYFYQRLGDFAYQLAVRRVRDAYVAHSIAQDAAVKVWNFIRDNTRMPDNIRAFTTAIVKNLCNDYFRSPARDEEQKCVQFSEELGQRREDLPANDDIVRAMQYTEDLLRYLRDKVTDREVEIALLLLYTGGAKTLTEAALKTHFHPTPATAFRRLRARLRPYRRDLRVFGKRLPQLALTLRYIARLGEPQVLKAYMRSILRDDPVSTAATEIAGLVLSGEIQHLSQAIALTGNEASTIVGELKNLLLTLERVQDPLNVRAPLERWFSREASSTQLRRSQ